MTTDPLAGLQSLTSFRTTANFRMRRTTLDVWQPGSRVAVARLAKAGPVRARAAYELFAGPGMAQVVGHITPSGAQEADGTPVGIINLSGGRVADSGIHPLSGARHAWVTHSPLTWRVVQPGLPPLTGTAEGRTTRLFFNRVTTALERGWLSDVVPDPGFFLVPIAFRFFAADSPGFIVRISGGSSRLAVRVDEPRLDRRLVLACLTALTAL